MNRGYSLHFFVTNFFVPLACPKETEKKTEQPWPTLPPLPFRRSGLKGGNKTPAKHRQWTSRRKIWYIFTTSRCNVEEGASKL